MLSVGKHKGKSFEEVAATDSGYCRWVLTIDSANGNLGTFQMFLKANGAGSGCAGRAAANPTAQGQSPPVANQQMPSSCPNPMFVGGQMNPCMSGPPRVLQQPGAANPTAQGQRPPVANQQMPSSCPNPMFVGGQMNPCMSGPSRVPQQPGAGVACGSPPIGQTNLCMSGPPCFPQQSIGGFCQAGMGMQPASRGPGPNSLQPFAGMALPSQNYPSQNYASGSSQGGLRIPSAVCASGSPGPTGVAPCSQGYGVTPGTPQHPYRGAGPPCQTPGASQQACTGIAPGVSYQSQSMASQPVKLDGVIAVVELVTRERFELRPERMEEGCSVGFPGWLPKQAFADISGWPDNEFDTAKKCWTFPLSSYRDIEARLVQRKWPYEAIPDFVLNALLRKDPIQTESQKLPDLHESLMPYQREGVEFGYRQAKGRVLIGDEMGLGKTLQALVLASFYLEEWPVLVICPSSVRFVWKEQATKWLPHLCSEDSVQVITKGKTSFRSDATVWVISYNLLADSRTGSKFTARPDGQRHRVVICDESHNIKEWKTQKTRTVVSILDSSDRAILLSGTPIRNNPDDIHPQLCGLKLPGLLKPHLFRRRYCRESTGSFGGQSFRKVAGARNAAELNLVLTSTIMIRRLKKDVLKELPEKRRQKVPIEPAATKLVKELRGQMENMADESISMLFKKLASVKLPEVKEYVVEVLDRGNEKFIVFGHHHVMLDGLEEALQKRLKQDGLSYVRICGATPAAKRLDYVNEFQDNPDCRVALLSITACCEGLTLTAAGLVIFAELYWVPGTVEQAEARAHRIGTKHTKVVVEFLVVPGTPDDLIFNKLERKKRDCSSILDNLDETFEADTLCQRTLGKNDATDEASPAASRTSRSARGRGRPKASPRRKSLDDFLFKRARVDSPRAAESSTTTTELTVANSCADMQ